MRIRFEAGPRILLLTVAVLGVTAALAQTSESTHELRVCADPDNLPFSNDRLEGFENKIADFIAKEMNAAVNYTWLSQRGSFVRKTLIAGRCDVIMTVPGGYDQALLTKPYYRSTYVFVYAKEKKLDLHSFDDPVLRRARIGIHAFGEDGTSPITLALGERGIVDQTVGFTLLNTEDSPKQKIIDAVARDEIDVAVVWGPFGGYYARREPVEMEVVPISPGNLDARLPFAFDICMGVRLGDKSLKGELDQIIDRRHDQIGKILADFGVPVVAPVMPTVSRSERRGASTSDERR